MSIGINKRLIAFIVALVISLAALPGVLFYGILSPVSSAAAYSYSKTLSISNGDFKTFSGSLPYTPSSWSTATGSSSMGGIKAGVIDIKNVSDLGELSNASFVNDSRPDDNVLMIQSQNTESSYGYKNSSAVQLGADSYFKISVDLKTVSSSNGASIYLSGVTPEDEINNEAYSFVGVTSANSPSFQNYKIWDTFTFWVETSTAASSMTLELWLGSRNNTKTTSGSVFFDSVSVEEIGHADFYDFKNNIYNESNSSDTKHNRIISLSEGVVSDALINGDFEQGSLGWESSEYSSEGTTFSGVANISGNSETRGLLGLEETDTPPKNTGTYGNQGSLYISNTEASLMSYKTVVSDDPAINNTITINQFGFYKISIWAKTGKLSGGDAWATLSEVVADTDGDGTPDRTPLSQTISNINSNSGVESRNGYQQHTFYVAGSPFKSVELSLSLGLGNTSSLVSGYVIFDDITVTQISGESYSAASKASDLTFNTSSNTSDILNGKFDFADSKTIQTIYPLAAQSWTANQENSNSGIVSLNRAHWEANANALGYGYGTAVRPSPITSYYGTESDPEKTQNNVLMMRNTQTTELSFKSSAFNITASGTDSVSYTSVELYMQTQYATGGGVDIEIITDSGFALCSIYDTVSDNTWTKYTLLIKNTSKDFSANLLITLNGKDNGESYAFVDYIKVTRTGGAMLSDSHDSYTNPKLLDDTRFNALSADFSGNVAVSNLDVDSFSYFGEEISNGLYASKTFSAEPKDGVIAGVVSLAEMGIPSKEGANPYALMIHNNTPTHFDYTSNIEYSLSAGSYYKFSVWIYTQGITGEEIQHDEEVEGDFGVFLKVSGSGIDRQFKGIKTKTDSEEGYNDTNNGWENYIFYIKAVGVSPATLTLSLGNADFPTQGIAFFDDVTMQLSDETTYNSFITNADSTDEDPTFKTTDDSGAHLMFGSTTAADDSTDNGSGTDNGTNDGTDNTAPQNGDNLFIVIPSIVIVLAIVVALVGYFLRKANWKRPIRTKKAAAYNRKGTLEEELIRKELATVRAEKVKKIDKQLGALENVIDENKAAYETAAKQETNKTKAEKMFNKYAKERSALQRKLDNLIAAKTYITDETNIRLEENKEMHRRAAELEYENKKLQKDAEKENTKNKK